jgi:hypothetical protein
MPSHKIDKFLLCRCWRLTFQESGVNRYRPHNRNSRLYVEVFTRHGCHWVFYDAAQDPAQGTTFAEFVVTFYNIRKGQHTWD